MNKSTQSREKIISLQALRAIGFIGIFLVHAGSSISWPALGVSVFYVMSGFLMMYQYMDKDLNCSLRNNMLFSKDKIKKLYPLHIITMCLAIVLNFASIIYNGITFRRILILIGKIFLNVTLLQTWFPYSYVNVSLNGVAWYLSVTAFLYCVFPYLKKCILKMNRKTILFCSCTILLTEILICVPWIYFLGADSNVYIWFMYCFPIFRLGDFFIGCCFGKEYIERPLKKQSLLKGTIAEIMATIITILVFIWVKQDHNNIFLIATHNWTTLYIPLAVIWVNLFARNFGIITKLLCNRITIFIGNISAYTFLIHYVVTQWTYAGLTFLHIEVNGMAKYSVILLEFIVSIVVTIFYMRLSKKKIIF